VFGIVAFLFIAGLIMHFSLAGVMERLEKKEAPQDQLTGIRREGSGAVVETQAVPHLQISPPEDLAAFRAREDAELNTYGWINRTAGVARIPIDRAMDLVLQRGLPERSGSNEDQLGPSPYELQQRRAQSPGKE
jgi:hypothetical protein